MMLVWRGASGNKRPGAVEERGGGAQASFDELKMPGLRIR